MSRACLYVVLALGEVGCSVGAAYHRPDAPVPTAWRGAPDATASGWPASDWWRGFGSPQLNDYIAGAQAANDDIAAAVARIQQADAQARIAGAALLPLLTGSAVGSRQRNFSIAGAAPAYSEYSPQLAASYQLDFWGKNRQTYNAALFAAQASRFDRETVALTVFTSVAMTYFEVLEARDRLQVAQDNLGNAQHILDGLQLEQTVGTATALDVAQQATTVATVNASIPPLAQQLQQNIDALAILLGRSPESIDVAAGSLDDISLPAVVAGVPSELLARRPDVAEAEAQLKEANANIAVARAAYFPSIDLTAAGGYASKALSSVLMPQSSVFALTAALTQTIFDAGTRKGQLQYARGRYAELLSDYHKTVLTALGNVEDALVAVQQTAQQQLRQQDATDKARRAFEYAQLQMQAGTTNVLTELSTETALFTAQDELVQVRYQHLQALIDLYEALGGGWRQAQAAQ